MRTAYDIPARSIALVLFATWAISLPAPTQAQGKGGQFPGVWREAGPDGGAEQIVFSFHREELGAGRISVRRGEEGPRYVGSYLRLAPRISEARVRVFFTHWTSDAFGDYRYGPMGAALERRRITVTEFRSRYAGHVVAKLQSNSGGDMRCLFELEDPKLGMTGGVTGACQLSNGETIRVPGGR